MATKRLLMPLALSTLKTPKNKILLPTIFSQGLSVKLFLINLATLNCGTIKNHFLMKLKATSNCWICEGWSEFKFGFQLPPSLLNSEDSLMPNSEPIDYTKFSVQLHISCDKYAGELLMPEDEESGGTFYSTIRMVPPGEATFYYTVND